MALGKIGRRRRSMIPGRSVGAGLLGPLAREFWRNMPTRTHEAHEVISEESAAGTTTSGDQMPGRDWIRGGGDRCRGLTAGQGVRASW